MGTVDIFFLSDRFCGWRTIADHPRHVLSLCACHGSRIHHAHNLSCTPRSPGCSQTQDAALLLLVQQIRLLPQRIRLELPERSLYPVSAFSVRANLLSSPESARQQPSLTTEEDASGSQEDICSHIANRTRLHHPRQVWDGLLSTTRELDGSRLFVRFEGIEDGGST